MPFDIETLGLYSSMAALGNGCHLRWTMHFLVMFPQCISLPICCITPDCITHLGDLPCDLCSRLIHIKASLGWTLLLVANTVSLFYRRRCMVLCKGASSHVPAGWRILQYYEENHGYSCFLILFLDNISTQAILRLRKFR